MKNDAESESALLHSVRRLVLATSCGRSFSYASQMTPLWMPRPMKNVTRYALTLATLVLMWNTSLEVSTKWMLALMKTAMVFASTIWFFSGGNAMLKKYKSPVSSTAENAEQRK